MGKRLTSKFLLLLGIVLSMLAVWNQFNNALAGAAPTATKFTILCAAIQATPQQCAQITWLHVATYSATVLAALIGIAALWQRSNEGRASIILKLDDRWIALATIRNSFDQKFDALKAKVKQANVGVEPDVMKSELRVECRKELERLDRSTDPAEKTEYDDLIEYLGFFETLGMMVKRGYIPLGEIVDLYKGPILGAGTFFSEHVYEWDSRPGVEPGVFENVMYLANWTQRYNERWWIRWFERAWI